MTYGGETCAFAYVLRVQTVFSQERIVQGCENTEQCVAKCAKSKILNRQLGETDEEVYAELKDKI